MAKKEFYYVSEKFTKYNELNVGWCSGYLAMPPTNKLHLGKKGWVGAPDDCSLCYGYLYWSIL